jgi:hypothetical protein
MARGSALCGEGGERRDSTSAVQPLPWAPSELRRAEAQTGVRPSGFGRILALKASQRVALWHSGFQDMAEFLSPRRAGLAGLAAVFIYVVATLAGSWLDPHYSQLDQHVSDLTATGAPTRSALVPFYLVYNGATVAFAFGLYLASLRTRWDRIGAALLLINAFAGIMMVTPFAEDLGGTPTTMAGLGHLWFAGLSSLAIVAGSFVYGAAFRHYPGMHRLSNFSLALGVVFLVLGPLAVLATATETLAGLAERGPIGTFLVWLTTVSLTLVRIESSRADVQEFRRGAA